MGVEIIRIRLIGGPRDGVEFEAAKATKYVDSVNSELKAVRYNASDEWDGKTRLFYYGGKTEALSGVGIKPMGHSPLESTLKEIWANNELRRK